MRRWLLAAALATALPATAQELAPDQAAVKAHVQFLAADALRGRKAGTPDHAIAAEYVAAEMLRAGLAPAGEGGGWFQSVGLTTFRATDRGTAAITLRNARVELKPGADFLLFPNPVAGKSSVSGAVVFAGHGLVYPAGGIDDYAGLDVRGKIVAMVAGLPAGLPGDVEAHFGNDEARAQLAAARGAKGVILLDAAPDGLGSAFPQAAAYWNYPVTRWSDPQGRTDTVAAPVLALLSAASAEKLFANARLRWAAVLAAERAGKPLPRGPLVATFEATVTSTNVRKTSRNVVGVLRGSDPRLRDEVVVLSAHLDHLGVGAPVKGDRIYNGAIDNALGVAATLEVARAFQASGKPPRRSILFLAPTAEEAGLLGSSYFAHFPTVPGKLVADINLDMPIITYPLQDLVVLGGERSSLGPVLTAAAAGEGLATVPDPAPEEMFFVRSDHYSFVQAGVPSVSVDSGPGGPGEAAQRDFLEKHYHQPSDDLSLLIDWPSVAKFVRVNYAATRAIADADARPRWNPGDFFGATFGGESAK